MCRPQLARDAFKQRETLDADEDLVGPHLKVSVTAPITGLSSGETLLTALAGGDVGIDFLLWGGEQRQAPQPPTTAPAQAHGSLAVSVPIRATSQPAPPPPPQLKLPQGRPDSGKWELPAGAVFESAEETAALSLPELRARFKAMYGVKSESNNRSWIIKKLTGQKQAGAAAAASGSGGELLQQQPAAGEKRKGATIVHTRVAGAKFLLLKDVLAMSMAEKRAAFEAIYGEPTKSGNGDWLERKLTGNCKRRAAKRGRSGD